MGIFDFMKNAGEKIFKPGEAKKETAIKAHLDTFGSDFAGVSVEVDGDVATLSGSVPSTTAREKAVLIAGNIDGIDKVDDRLVGADPGTGHPQRRQQLAAAEPARLARRKNKGAQGFSGTHAIDPQHQNRPNSSLETA